MCEYLTLEGYQNLLCALRLKATPLTQFILNTINFDWNFLQMILTAT